MNIKNVTYVAGGIEQGEEWYTVFYFEDIDGIETMQKKKFDNREDATYFHSKLAKFTKNKA